MELFAKVGSLTSYTISNGLGKWSGSKIPVLVILRQLSACMESNKKLYRKVSSLTGIIQKHPTCCPQEQQTEQKLLYASRQKIHSSLAESPNCDNKDMRWYMHGVSPMGLSNTVKSRMGLV